MESLLIMLACIAVICFALAAGALVADYILPHSTRLNRYIDNLPMMELKEENEYEEKQKPIRNRSFSKHPYHEGINISSDMERLPKHPPIAG